MKLDKCVHTNSLCENSPITCELRAMAQDWYAWSCEIAQWRLTNSHQPLQRHSFSRLIALHWSLTPRNLKKHIILILCYLLSLVTSQPAYKEVVANVLNNGTSVHGVLGWIPNTIYFGMDWFISDKLYVITYPYGKYIIMLTLHHDKLLQLYTNLSVHGMYFLTLQKLAHRRSAFAGLSFPDESSKTAWKGVLTVDMMSSEESTDEGDEEVYLRRPLPWRSGRLTEMLKLLDSRFASNQSALSHRQSKRRITTDEHSTRPKPASGTYPPWAFASTYMQ